MWYTVPESGYLTNAWMVFLSRYAPAEFFNFWGVANYNFSPRGGREIKPIFSRADDGLVVKIRNLSAVSQEHLSVIFTVESLGKIAFMVTIAFHMCDVYGPSSARENIVLSLHPPAKKYYLEFAFPQKLKYSALNPFKIIINILIIKAKLLCREIRTYIKYVA